MSSSIFTRIINREIPAHIEYEDDEVIVIHDIQPQAPVHLLIIPKESYPTLNDVPDTSALLIGNMVMVATAMAKKHGIDESGYRLVVNCNPDGGQIVYHLHIHLLGGKKLGHSA
jgi:histidine triad (HIT) family protein